MKAARIWYAAPMLLLAALGGYILWRAQPLSVEATAPRIGPAVELVYATGFVEAEQPVSVAARLTAPVVAVLVREADRVHRGQPLVVLEDDEQHGMLAQAAAEREAAILDERRARTLFAKGWTTRAARDRAVATANAARAAEESARARLSQHIVRAGIDGVVLKRDVEPGDLATPSRVLLLLGDPARIRVTATVDERDVPRLRIGQPALMTSDAWPGRIIHGHLRELTPGGDPTQRAFRARLALDDALALPIGLTLEINMVTRRAERALLVPASAIASSQLWVVADGRARRRHVVPGIAGANDVQIVSGLQPGELVITNPSAELAEGDRVAIRKAKDR
jgi:RND family efflux transporter MFP subunit